MMETATKSIQRYPAYKDSGINEVGDIPEEWQVTPIFSVMKPKSITNRETEELLSVYLDLGVIKFSDVNEKRTNVTSKDLSNYQLVEPGDFVLNNQQAWRGSVGVSKHKGIVSPAYIVLELDKSLNSTYANYLLRNSSMVTQYLISSKGVGTIQRNLYWPSLRRSSIVIPPLPEQTAIAHFLDDKTKKIDRAVSIKEKQIALLKERRQIIIQELVTGKKVWNEANQVWEKPEKTIDSGVEWIGQIPEGWEVVKLKLLSNKIVDGAHFTPTYVDEGIPFLRVTDLSKMKNGKINWDKVSRIPNKEHLELIKRAHPEKGDVLLSKNGTIGLTKVIDWDREFSFFVSLCLIKLNKRVKPEYFTKYFNSPIVDKQINDSSSRTSVTNLHLEKIKELLVVLPKIYEQILLINEMERHSEKIDQAISIKEREIEKLKEYKASLVNDVVLGRVKVI